MLVDYHVKLLIVQPTQRKYVYLCFHTLLFKSKHNVLKLGHINLDSNVQHLFRFAQSNTKPEIYHILF